jgi:transcriptional regulator with XRE-family HTH domain
MAKRGDPNVTRLVVIVLRSYARMTQTRFGKAARVDQSDISRWELGKAAPPEEALRRMAEAAGVGWNVVLELGRFFAAMLAAVATGRPIFDTQPVSPEVLEPILLAIAPYLIEDRLGEAERPSAAEARREAEEIWIALERFPIPKRRRLIEQTLHARRSWALAQEVSYASERAASNSARDALELAGLALSIADRVPGESLRFRVQGYCWAYVANARRVANDLEGADEAFTRAWDLWWAGAASDPELLPEWRVLDLEASLRRAERRFPQALALLDQARAASGEEPMAVGRILLKKEHVFDQIGDTEAALAVLAEAAPFVEASGDPRQLLSLRFKTANNLWHLKRYEESARMLAQVRELAVEQGNELDLIRVVWLDARIAAAQGRPEEATAGLEQVRRDFAGHELPYDAALASLDLAVLWLEAGRTGEVRELAVEMQAIFQAKRIDREALAALTLFCKAARQETATVELAQRVRAYLQRAKHQPGLRFEAESREHTGRGARR